MCKFNISFNDTVVDEVRPLFTDEHKMLLWMQVEMERLMRNYVAQHKRTIELNECLLLSKLKALPNSPEGFLQLDSVLHPSQSSIEDLREEAYAEKYGI